jgi:hypothetical protein
MVERILEFRKKEEPPFTEPVIIDCVYVNGIEVDAEDDVVRLTGWTNLPDLGGEMAERRIVSRLALAARAARDLRRKLNDRLRETE